MLEKRTIREVRGGEADRNAQQGCLAFSHVLFLKAENKQGSNLGPLLFNIYMLALGQSDNGKQWNKLTKPYYQEIRFAYKHSVDASNKSATGCARIFFS